MKTFIISVNRCKTFKIEASSIDIAVKRAIINYKKSNPRDRLKKVEVIAEEETYI